MGVFVFLPLVLPLTAWPVARLAEQHLHPRTATRLLTAMAAVLALCSTVCLGLVMVVGTAQLPGNPLPDGWSDPEVRAAVPYDEVVGKAAIPALCVVVVACARTLWRHARVRRQAHRALSGLPDTEVAVLPDGIPYAYALPGGRRAVVCCEAFARAVECCVAGAMAVVCCRAVARTVVGWMSVARAAGARTVKAWVRVAGAVVLRAAVPGAVSVVGVAGGSW
ncbi:putative Glycoprotein gp2 [Streptomyces afghaniensis 772]|uniref:Putative Glycoprotein gp2 n=1 Tax=Streptomyces afghaniensis 772 TaxID=1283301 RepID=S4MYZ2_9ACTN|nr:putative Glycoprotein gp2 [Streptomyces afghaniensis 772]